MKLLLTRGGDFSLKIASRFQGIILQEFQGFLGFLLWLFIVVLAAS